MIDKIDNTFNTKSKTYVDDINHIYTKYINTVSADYMAASLEVCVFLMVLCDVIRPKSFLDLGSGISSCAVRLFKEKYFNNMCVWSIDSDANWLNKSRDFVVDAGLDADNFELWENIKHNTDKFDLIFFDIDYTKNRVNYIDPVLKSFTSDNSFIVFDDMHKGILVNAIKTFLSNYEYGRVNIKKYTLDKYKRFSGLYYNILDKG